MFKAFGAFAVAVVEGAAGSRIRTKNIFRRGGRKGRSSCSNASHAVGFSFRTAPEFHRTICAVGRESQAAEAEIDVVDRVFRQRGDPQFEAAWPSLENDGSMMSMPKQRSLWMDALWLSLLAIYILAGAALVPFHGDESTLIFMGRDYYHGLAKIVHDDSSDTERHLRMLNGTIAKTIYGWIAVSSGLRLDELNNQWRWDKDYAYNRDTNRIPDDDLLYKGRLASAFQLILALLAFFLFVRMTIHRPAAWLAGALFALHPTILLNGRRAMMEGSHLLGMMLVLLAAAWLMRGRKWWGYPALGAAAGFAIATKHPNVIVMALAFFACFSLGLVQAIRQRQTFAKIMAGLWAAGLLMLLVFYALNPAWWASPLASAQQALPLRTKLMEKQVQTFGGYPSLGERIDGFFRYVFAGEIQYFEVSDWAGHDVIQAQIGVYQGSGLAGVGADGSGAGGLLFLLLALFGSIHLCRNDGIPWSYRWLLLVWGLGMMTLTFILTPLPWARYYLPTLPFMASMAAYSLLTLAECIWKQIKAAGYGFTVLD